MMIAFSLTNRLRLGQAKGGLGFKLTVSLRAARWRSNLLIREKIVCQMLSL